MELRVIEPKEEKKQTNKQRLIKGNKIEIRVMEPIEKQLCGKRFTTYIQVIKEYK